MYAVILQRMIPAVLAGVSFSKNPVNDKHEVIVEAVEGPGEELMQKGATPLRWKLKNKHVREGDTHHPQIGIIRKVADSTMKLKRHYGKHIDLEWVYDGHSLYYVQLRSITAEKTLNVYSNKMAKEMLPGQIKPLVWSVNIPLVIGAKIHLLSRITGPLSIQAEELAKSFYNRTYFNVAKLGEVFSEFGVPLESIENTMLSDTGSRHSFRPGAKTLRHTLRIISFIHYLIRFEKVYLKEYRELFIRYKELGQKFSGELSLEEYSQNFEELCTEGKRLTHLNVLIPLLMRIYNSRFSKKLKRIGVAYDRLDFLGDFPEAESYSPLPDIRHIQQGIEALPPALKETCTTYEALKQEEGAAQIKEEIQDFMERFGHFSESGNDFSYPKWQEDPEFVFRMILNHTEAKREHEAIAFKEIRYSKLRHPMLESSYRKAGRFKVYREQVSSLYILGYGLFRNLFLKLAEAFREEGLLDTLDDIFYLTKTEVDELFQARDQKAADSCRTKVRERKAEMEASADLVLPSVIYGEEAPLLDLKDLQNLKGTGTSSGNYTGRARIVRESQDFEKVKDGDVVIIPFSDVSWTPILCKAGAIVAESGGMLSHCSIIAREMGIPSLVSVEHACEIKDNVLVTVDGCNGQLSIHEHE
jgi:phosphohistidine swiveling domain-containing protein